MSSSGVSNPNGVTELFVEGRTALPGEPILHVADGGVVSLGAGLRRVAGEARQPNAPAGGVLVVAAFSGVVDRISIPGMPVRYTIESTAAKRYAPRKGDPVVGVVLRVTSTAYLLHINAAHPATLDVLAFDGASKTNRPKLAIGDVVYCHVTRCDRSTETEVGCQAVGKVRAKDWTTGESMFGHMEGGTLLHVSLRYAANLLAGSQGDVLQQLGEKVEYEACVGLNGVVWVGPVGAAGRKGGATPHSTLPQIVAVSCCIQECEPIHAHAHMVRERVLSYFE